MIQLFIIDVIYKKAFKLEENDIRLQSRKIHRYENR